MAVIPAGWDATTYQNFKKANPNLEPTAFDTKKMLETQPALGSTERTNQLLGGQYFNPNTGGQIKPFTPPTITAESMQGATQLPPTPERPAETDFGAITASIADSFKNQPEELGTPYTDTSVNLLSSIKSLLGETSGKAEYSAQAFEASGANELAKRQRELTARATALNNEVSSAQLSLERDAGTKGLSTTLLNRQLREVSRNAAIQSLAINSEYAMNAGNLETAKESAQRAVDIKYGDIESKIEQNTKLLELYSPFMTAEQNERAEARAAANLEKKTELADKKKAQQDLINFAQERGDAKTASEAIRLDPNSSTFQDDLADLQSTIAPDREQALDIALKQAQLSKTIRETSLLGEPTPKEREDERKRLASEQGQIETLKDKVSLVDEILGSSGISTRVGTSVITRKPSSIIGSVAKTLFPPTTAGGLKDITQQLTGEGQQFAGGVHKLASREFLDALIGAKQQGATFGALTDREGDALRAAATQLNDWEVKDKNGNPLGIWNIDEASFRRELNSIKELANRAITKSGGSILSSDEQSQLDELYGSQEASSYYTE